MLKTLHKAWQPDEIQINAMEYLPHNQEITDDDLTNLMFDVHISQCIADDAIQDLLRGAFSSDGK